MAARGDTTVPWSWILLFFLLALGAFALTILVISGNG